MGQIGIDPVVRPLPIRHRQRLRQLQFNVETVTVPVAHDKWQRGRNTLHFERTGFFLLHFRMAADVGASLGDLACVFDILPGEADAALNLGSLVRPDVIT